MWSRMVMVDPYRILAGSFRLCQVTWFLRNLRFFVLADGICFIKNRRLKDFEAISHPWWKLIDAHCKGHFGNWDNLDLSLHSNGVLMNCSTCSPSRQRSPKHRFSEICWSINGVASVSRPLLVNLHITTAFSPLSPHQLNQHGCRPLDGILFSEFSNASRQVLVLAGFKEMFLHLTGFGTSQRCRSRLPFPCRELEGTWEIPFPEDNQWINLTHMKLFHL